MKQLTRLNEPITFFKGDTKIEFYKNLKDNNGKIRARWNFPIYRNEIRRVLIETSDGECAYCGKKVNDDDFDIEHFLPKEKFPYLSYYFDNYLCSCKSCNQNKKKSYYPMSLDSKSEKLCDPILDGELENIIPYDRDAILKETTDRIIEPTFDKIEEHLEFEPASCNYQIKNNSSIGYETNKMFFDHREFVSRLQKISNQIVGEIKSGTKKEVVLAWGEILGYSFYIEKLYDFWYELLE